MESSEQSSPHPYSISVEEFGNIVDSPIDYNFSEPVNRNNFLDFLVSSFEISRADASAQAEWMKYLYNKTGFNAVSTLEHFLEAGALDVLGESERKIFDDKFRRVGMHKEEGINLELQFDEAIEVLIEKLKKKEPLIEGSVNMDEGTFLRTLRHKVRQRRIMGEYLD